MPSRFGNAAPRPASAAPPAREAERWESAAPPPPRVPVAEAAAPPGADSATESDYDSDGTASDVEDAQPYARRTAAFRRVERTRSRSASPPKRPPMMMADGGGARDGPAQPSTPAGASRGSVDDLATAAPLRSVYSSPTGADEDGGGDSDMNVAVVCRVRPTSAIEESTGRTRQVIDFDEDGRTVHLHNLEQPTTPGQDKSRRGGRQKLHSFRFRAVFKQRDTQELVYERVGRPLVDSVMEGYNAAVIAYGQTGSGKTYTMIGDEHEPTEPEGFGMIPRLTHDIFERIETRKQSQVVDVVRCSYIEIYMERVRDLLSAAGTQSSQDLPLRDDKRRGGLWVAGATEVPVSGWSDVAAILAKGNLARMTAATQSNENSSRSHAIFIFAIATNDLRAMLTTTSQLYAVDLAGSENVRKSEVEGLQMEEAKKINTSLLALGQVVYALTQGSQSGRHVPYRDSKLTRILQNTFGGNSRTAMIINSSPAEENYRETLSSLRFGDRTQAVRNAPTANVYRSAEELEKLLAMAEEEMKSIRELTGVEVQNLGVQLAQLTEERNHWRSKVDDLKAALVAAQAALANKDAVGAGGEEEEEEEIYSDTESEDGTPRVGAGAGAGRRVRVRAPNGDIVTRTAGDRGSSAGQQQQKQPGGTGLGSTADGDGGSDDISGLGHGGRTSSSSSAMASARLAALRTLSSLAPAPSAGEELFTLLRASPWAVVAVDSETRDANGVVVSGSSPSPRLGGGGGGGGGGGVAAGLYGCILHFDGDGLTVTGNDLWKALIMRRRGPTTPGRGDSRGERAAAAGGEGGGQQQTGLHTEHAAVEYCCAAARDSSSDLSDGSSTDSLLVSWGVSTAQLLHEVDTESEEDEAGHDHGGNGNGAGRWKGQYRLPWSVEMVRRDGEENVELTGELLPPLPAQAAAAAAAAQAQAVVAGGGKKGQQPEGSRRMISTLVLQRLPGSVMGVVQVGLAAAHQRMRDAQIATIQAQKGLERMAASKHKLTQAVDAAEQEAARNRERAELAEQTLAHAQAGAGAAAGAAGGGGSSVVATPAGGNAHRKKKKGGGGGLLCCSRPT